MSNFQKVCALLSSFSLRFQDSDGELATVRQKCVCLLGSLGGSNNVAMVTCSADDIAKVAVAWDTEKNLKFDVPFMDIKPSIYFGEFQKKCFL